MGCEILGSPTIQSLLILLHVRPKVADMNRPPYIIHLFSINSLTSCFSPKGRDQSHHVPSCLFALLNPTFNANVARCFRFLKSAKIWARYGLRGLRISNQPRHFTFFSRAVKIYRYMNPLMEALVSSLSNIQLSVFPQRHGDRVIFCPACLLF